MVIPAPLVRSRTSVSPNLNSSCMASQQEADQEQFPGMCQNIYAPLGGCAAQPDEQLLSEVINRIHQSALQSDWTGAKRAPGNIQRPAGLKITFENDPVRP